MMQYPSKVKAPRNVAQNLRRVLESNSNNFQMKMHLFILENSEFSNKTVVDLGITCLKIKYKQRIISKPQTGEFKAQSKSILYS